MRRLLLAWILALPCATGVAAAPLEPFPEDHHGCVQAFLGTVIQMDVREAPRGPSDDRFFYTEAVVAVDSVLAGIPADTLRVVTGHSLRFHPDGFLDGYQEDGSGLVWFRTGDHVLIASPLLPESGVADATQPFLASFSRLFERPFTGGDQPARIIVGYSLAPLLEGEAPARLLGDAEALLNRVGVETVESCETLEQRVHAVEKKKKKRCGTRLFETEGQVVARKHTYTVPDARLRGVAVRPDGDWVLVDEARHTVGILSRRGDVLFQWGGNGSGDGQFSRPQDAAVDASGDIDVTDPGNHRSQRFNFGGTYSSRWGSEGIGKA